jgi:hypothetical protein
VSNPPADTLTFLFIDIEGALVRPHLGAAQAPGGTACSAEGKKGYGASAGPRIRAEQDGAARVA